MIPELSFQVAKDLTVEERGGQRVSASPFICCGRWWEADPFASQPTLKIKARTSPQGRAGGAQHTAATNSIEMLLGLPPSLVPTVVATAEPTCFASSACNEMLLAPGWLFANVNVLQTLLLITQSH